MLLSSGAGLDVSPVTVLSLLYLCPSRYTYPLRRVYKRLLLSLVKAVYAPVELWPSSSPSIKTISLVEISFFLSFVCFLVKSSWKSSSSSCTYTRNYANRGTRVKRKLP